MGEFGVNFLNQRDFHLDYIHNQNEAKGLKGFPNYDRCTEYHIKSQEMK